MATNVRFCLSETQVDTLLTLYEEFLDGRLAKMVREAVLRSRSRMELPLLGRLRSRSRFFFRSEPGAGAALFKAAPAAYFKQAKKKSLVLVSNMTLKAV